MTYLLDTTFVANDKNGLWIALRELWMPGERLLGLAVFLRRLFEQSTLEDPLILDEVMSVAGGPAQRPTWWAPWRAALGSTTSPVPPTPLSTS